MTSIYINWGAIIWCRIVIISLGIYFVVLGRNLKRYLKQRKHTKFAVGMIANLGFELMELELRDVDCK